MHIWRLVGERQRQVGAGGKVDFVVGVVLLHRRKILSEEGTRMARVLDSLGQVAAWYTVGDGSQWGILRHAIT